MLPSVEELLEIRCFINRSVADSLSNSPDYQQVELLSEPEENSLRVYYESKIVDVSSYFKFDNYIQTAAILLHKRFYLKQSMMKWDAKAVMMACLFLGSKVGNLHLEVEHLSGKVPGATAESILKHEFCVLTEVSFNLAIPDVDSGVEGMLLHLRRHLPGNAEMQEVRAAAQDTLVHAKLSDILITFSCSYVCLAVAIVACKGNEDSIAAFISTMPSEMCQKTLSQCIHQLRLFAKPDQSLLKEADLKQKKCSAFFINDRNK